MTSCCLLHYGSHRNIIRLSTTAACQLASLLCSPTLHSHRHPPGFSLSHRILLHYFFLNTHHFFCHMFLQYSVHLTCSGFMLDSLKFPTGIRWLDCRKVCDRFKGERRRQVAGVKDGMETMGHRCGVQWAAAIFIFYYKCCGLETIT